MVDYHASLHDGLSLEQALRKSRERGIQYGTTAVSTTVKNDALTPSDGWVRLSKGRCLDDLLDQIVARVNSQRSISKLSDLSPAVHESGSGPSVDLRQDEQTDRCSRQKPSGNRDQSPPKLLANRISENDRQAACERRPIRLARPDDSEMSKCG